MKVVVKKKDNIIPVWIHTEFIKLQDALKFANVVYSGGAGFGERGSLHHAGQKAAPRGHLHLPESDLPHYHP